MTFEIGQVVNFAGTSARVRSSYERHGEPAVLIESGEVALPMWVPASVLERHQTPVPQAQSVFQQQQIPSVIAVDDFFRDPDEVRAIALAAVYSSDARYYKGLRSDHRYLWPSLREEFARLVGRTVTEWLGHDANGVFQQTNHDDPLVWHHDSQGYAAAIYLTPDPPPGSGTSFWRDRTYGCRRSPSHPLEQSRLGDAEAVRKAESVVYDPYNIGHPDNWELVEAVAGLYNRLVIWDAHLIHSATSYEHFSDEGAAPSRLVQLFFFDVDLADRSPAP